MSHSVYDRRWANAQRIGKLIEAALAEGSYVFNEAGDRVTAVHWRGFLNGEDQHNPGLTIDCGGPSVYFNWDKDTDEGMHTPIAEFNAHFDGWWFVKPEHIQTLLGGSNV